MQDIAPLTPADLLSPLQELLYKIEVKRGEEWIDLCDLGGENYLVENTLRLKLGGAGMSPLPVAGEWSAEIHNEDGIFHPFHPSSPFADLFRIGREVRISVGGDYKGSRRHWQRLVGFMDAPQFDHVKRTVTISGKDCMKRLTDTRLGDEPRVIYMGTGEHDDPDIIHGPTRWGGRVRTDSKPSTGQTGPECYTNPDAVGPHDAGWMANWNKGWNNGPENMTISYSYWAGDPTQYAGRFEATGVYATGGCDECGGPLEMGKTYAMVFKYRRYAGSGDAALYVTQIQDGERKYIGYLPLDPPTNGVWHDGEIKITAHVPGDFGLMLFIRQNGAQFELTAASVKLYDPVWHLYDLPDDCVVPYKVILDGEQVSQGERDKDGHFDGWLYSKETRQLKFDILKYVPDGTGKKNLEIYYYTAQDLDNVLADLLAIAGYYADRAEALASMDYTPTGITIPRSWFELGCQGLEAVRKICERANYRFWFAYESTPMFRPAPVPTEPVFEFTRMGHLQNTSDFQDIKEVANRVVVEGAERAMFRTRDDKDRSRWVGEAADQDLIDESQEVTLPIDNHLFQDQGSVDTMAAALLAEFKVPKWYADMDLFANPVPLELGDTVSMTIYLDHVPTLIIITALIRDINIEESSIKYTCEVISWEPGEPVGAHDLLDGDVHYDTVRGDAEPGALIMGDGNPEIPLGSQGPDEHALLNGSVHPDTLSREPELGGLIMGTDSEPVKWTKLAAGEPGRILEMGAAVPAWGRKITSSDNPPGAEEGSDGDIHLEY